MCIRDRCWVGGSGLVGRGVFRPSGRWPETGNRDKENEAGGDPECETRNAQYGAQSHSSDIPILLIHRISAQIIARKRAAARSQARFIYMPRRSCALTKIKWGKIEGAAGFRLNRRLLGGRLDAPA